MGVIGAGGPRFQPVGRFLAMRFSARACTSLSWFALRVAGLGAALLCAPIAAALDWPRISAEELGDNKPHVEPDAPAEVLEWKLEIDDTPERDETVIVWASNTYLVGVWRTTTEYIRYKIYSPEDAAGITRISTRSRNLEVRLTLPNGQTREFSDNQLRTQTVARYANRASLWGRLTTADTDAEEGFLAIPGVERGSILEVRFRRENDVPRLLTQISLQLTRVPVRRVEVTWNINAKTNALAHDLFILNAQGGKVMPDSKPLAPKFVATNLCSLDDEPSLGPRSDYVTSLLLSYERLYDSLDERSHKVPSPGRVPANLGPWALYSTKMNWLERDRAFPTARIKALSAQVTAGKTDDLAKAKAVHAYASTAYQKFQRRAITRGITREYPQSLDDVLDWEKKPGLIVEDEEFTFLALALLQSAGMEAHLLLLPDRNFMRFNPKLVAASFLEDRAIAVRIGPAWRFMKPTSDAPLPFGLVPGRLEGQPALLALDHQQQFIPVPQTPGTESSMENTGEFAVDAAGTLVGKCQRTFTGHAATDLRRRLRDADPPRRRRIVRDAMRLDGRIVILTNPMCSGIDDPEQPLVLSADVSWPGFATRLKDRLIVRTLPLHAESPAKFSATTRRYPVCFTYRVQEKDRIAITVPEGFTPEFPTKPPSNPGDIFNHEVDLGYDAKRHTLHVTRTFSCETTDVPAKAYPALKRWYENVAQTDRHQVVFRGTNRPMPASVSATSAAAELGGTADDAPDADEDDESTD